MAKKCKRLYNKLYYKYNTIHRMCIYICVNSNAIDWYKILPCKVSHGFEGWDKDSLGVNVIGISRFSFSVYFSFVIDFDATVFVDGIDCDMFSATITLKYKC